MFFPPILSQPRVLGAHISPTGLTKLGNATGGGGLAAAFDGTTSQTNTSCATTASDPVWVGMTLAAPKRIFEVRCHGSDNAGYVNTTNPSITLTLYGKTGAAPGSATDGTAIGSITFTDTANESSARIITSTNNESLWDHVWVHGTGNGGQNWRIAELLFYEAN